MLILSFAAISSLVCAGPGFAASGSEILIGAFRWDRWYSDSPEIKVLSQPKWRSRIPFFARIDERGKIELDGDTEPVLEAEVAYADAIGLDYFIFGFYPDTNSWGRPRGDALALNRALSSYLEIPNNRNVQFAISLNQFFPMADLDDISSSIARLVSDRRYVRTQSGTAPLFVLAQDGLDFDRIFGSERNAANVFNNIRAEVRKTAGVELTIVVLHYDFEKAEVTRKKFDLDMLSTYSNFAPGEGPQPFAKCAIHNQAVWAGPRAKGYPYLPNVTVGWDSRPRGDFEVANGKPSVPRAWCLTPSAAELKSLFDSGKNEVLLSHSNENFKSLLIYAWNEFTEGGWLAPTWQDDESRLEDLRSAIGRQRTPKETVLRFPDDVEADKCPLQTAEKLRGDVVGRCLSDPTSQFRPWPCPPGTRVTREYVRGPSGFEARVWTGGWRVRVCTPAQ